jgi:hypothetical protein
MEGSISKNLAITSLVLGCIVYLFTIVTSVMMFGDMFRMFDMEDPSQIGDAFQRYFEILNRFQWPVVAVCIAGILTGIGGLRAQGRPKGMAIAGIILGAIYLLTHLILMTVFNGIISQIEF